MHFLSLLLVFAAGIGTSSSALAQEDDKTSAAMEAAADAMEAALEGDDIKAASSEDGLKSSEPQSVFDRGCGDDRGVDRCDSDVRAKMLDLYGFSPAEELALQNVAMLRGMIVDGYGRDTVAISFMREPGQTPYVDVRAPSASPTEEQFLRASVPIADWEAVWLASANFDRQLVSEQGDESDTLRICLHGWVAVVESIETTSPHVSSTVSYDGGERVAKTEIVRPEARVYRDTESACAGGLAMPFAFEMARYAHRLLPQCSALDIDEYRNAAMLLSHCHRLRGDRHAAALASEVIKKLQEDLRGEADNFDRNFVELDESVAARFKKAIEGAEVYFGAPNAYSGTDATVEADLYYYGEDESDLPAEKAKMTIHLYLYASAFRVLSWTVSDREPFEMPDTE